MSLKIVIATHKKYSMPNLDIYLPLQVGASINKLELGYAKDNTGENISNKNPLYCELTGLYWAWKNLDDDYIGLVHYRRYFGKKQIGNDKIKSVLSKEEIAPYLKSKMIFLPKKDIILLRHYILIIHIRIIRGN